MAKLDQLARLVLAPRGWILPALIALGLTALLAAAFIAWVFLTSEPLCDRPHVETSPPANCHH